MNFYQPTAKQKCSQTWLEDRGVLLRGRPIEPELERLRKCGYYPITYIYPEYDPNFYQLQPKPALTPSEDGLAYVQDFDVVEVDLDTAKANRKAQVTAKRWEIETGGIEFNGVQVLTAIEDQNRIASICLSAVSSKVSGTTFTPVKFKTASGEWVTLDADTLIAIGDAVTAHVEHCFTNESRLHALCDEATSISELLAIDIEDGWYLLKEAANDEATETTA